MHSDDPERKGFIRLLGFGTRFGEHGDFIAGTMESPSEIPGPARDPALVIGRKFQGQQEGLHRMVSMAV